MNIPDTKSTDDAREKKRLYDQAYQQRTKETRRLQRRESKAKTYRKHHAKNLLDRAAYRKANPEDSTKSAARARKWYDANREQAMAASTARRKLNKARACEIEGRRRARMSEATDAGANRLTISVFYSAARRVSECIGIQHHVDHIMPISRGGRHHQNNLQVLPWRINCRKHNTIDFQVFANN